MKIGDKVKHINTGENVYTIIKLTENIATLKRPISMYKKLCANSKSSPIIDISICDIKNLIKI